ncbi:MAG: ABC transporter substrate-binding protein [Paracoccaceae bacterium]
MSIAHSRWLSATAFALVANMALADGAQLSIATQVSGTVNWELAAIQSHGLDKANGFTMVVQDVAAGPAAQLAFQAGEADVIVSDWLWVARQRAAGDDYVFIPYSRAVGALHVPKDSPVTKLTDLRGGKIGIAGGPIDKSWLILRAYAQQEAGFDIAAETEQVFGAPPLIFETAVSGELDAAINFWHFGAKMEAAGMRPLITVAQAAEALGLDPDTPLLGYVVRGELLREKPALVAGLAAASRAAKNILAHDDAAWAELRPIMNAKTDAQFDALVAGFRAGIPAPGAVDERAAQRMLTLMAGLGGEELVGKVTQLPAGIFVQPES